MVDRRWAERNLGFDPISTPAPPATFAFAPASTSSKDVDLQREIIDFDSEAPAGREFLAFTTTTGLSRFTEIPWPKATLSAPAESRGRDVVPCPQVRWRIGKGQILIVVEVLL